MAKGKSRKGKLGKAENMARALQDNQYLQSQYLHDLLEDEELRSSLLGTYEAARKAYGRVSDGKPMSALVDAHKLQREIKNTASAIQAPNKGGQRRSGLKRTLLLLSLSAVLAVALSESLRSKVLDMMFGAEEEFDYSSTTAPVTPAPAPEAVAGS
jgi:hypothetical protein